MSLIDNQHPHLELTSRDPGTLPQGRDALMYWQVLRIRGQHAEFAELSLKESLFVTRIPVHLAAVMKRVGGLIEI